MTAQSLLRSRGSAVSLAFVTTILVAGGLVYFYFFHPHVRVAQSQPIPFSHRLHVSVKEIDCRFCHSSAGHTPHAGIPSATKCLYCHEHIIPNHPYIREVQAAADSGEAIRWRKITWLPDHVYFSHQRHVQKGVACQSCHGPIETMDRVHEANRLKMGFCLECHKKKDAALDCWACHM